VKQTVGGGGAMSHEQDSLVTFKAWSALRGR
jgi:hypothetical protein